MYICITQKIRIMKAKKNIEQIGKQLRYLKSHGLISGYEYQVRMKKLGL